jgi:hypothetical protein
MRQRPGRVSCRSPAARKSVWCAGGGAVHRDSGPVVRGTDIFEDSHVFIVCTGKKCCANC